jgi:hypothetical protein
VLLDDGSVVSFGDYSCGQLGDAYDAYATPASHGGAVARRHEVRGGGAPPGERPSVVNRGAPRVARRPSLVGIVEPREDGGG